MKESLAELADLVGYRVLGRLGELGRVVELGGREQTSAPAVLVVRGGVSHSLIFHLPVGRLIGVSPETGTVATDVDVSDFIPRFVRDGAVELHLS